MKSVLFSVALFFCILTLAIALPIYVRPFYYAHIDAMDLPARSGFTREQIVEAYDQVLDYLTFPGKEFGTGELAHSESGKAHFADCKVLFDLNAGVLVGSALVLAIFWLMRKRWGPYRLGKRSAAFYGAAAAILLPIVLGSLAALDFDRAFVIFHTVFFPGKSNWVFNGWEDPIIRVLPQDFFMHCAMLIGAGVLVFAGGILIWEMRTDKKR